MKELLKKFKFKADPVIINAPADLQKAFGDLGFSTSFDKKEKAANVLVFITNNKDFLHFLNKQLSLVAYDAVLWFAYPKGTSKLKTDINRDTIRVTGEEYSITTVTAVSIDATWSALRFRPVDRVGK